MPHADGLSATAEIGADPALRATKVLVLTTFDVDEYVYRALRAGASGFLLKDADPTEPLRGMRLVCDGEALLAPTVTRRLIDEFVARPASPAVAAPSRLAVLTAREREVFALVGTGSTNDEIAARLVISPATARTHVGHILTKLDARDRVQLVVLAHEYGLVGPGFPAVNPARRSRYPSVTNGLDAISEPSSRRPISKSPNTLGTSRCSCRRHSTANDRISTSACSVARIATKWRQAR
jgi:DNA-binding NarL/FixJ family response regulator